MWTRNPFLSGLVSMSLAIVALVLATPQPAHGQFLNKLKERVTDSIEQESLHQVEEMARDQVKCVFNDFSCMQGAEESGDEYVLTDPDGKVLVDARGQSACDQHDVEQSDMGADSEPGDRPISGTAGGHDLYEVLEREGGFTARGILFDEGSPELQAASAAALAEIGTMLQAHPELRLSIEGHTDSDGVDAQNLTLERAGAVRDYLIESFGVDPLRLEIKGLGAMVPVAPNDTPAGRQANRRVELVRL